MAKESLMKSDRERLDNAIHAATNSPHTALDVQLLKLIKQMVRASEDNVSDALYLLMDRLKKNHSQVRYLCLLLIDELFMRSKLFRALFVPMFETFLLLSVGYRSDYALPAPSDRAALLRSKSIEFVEKWNDSFGQHYREIRLGYEYLKDIVRLQFPNLREVAARAQQQRSEREKRTQELIQKKYKNFQEEFTDSKKDVLFTLVQMEECFAILKADQGDSGIVKNTKEMSMLHSLQKDCDVGDGQEEHEVYGTRSLRSAMQEFPSDNVLHRENQDNAALFDSLRELLKLLTNKYIPATQEWMSVLMRVDLGGKSSNTHDVMLKEVIDIRNQLFSARSKCESLGLKSAISEDNSNGKENLDEIEWEIGEVSNDSCKQLCQLTNIYPKEQETVGVANDGSKSGEAVNGNLLSNKKTNNSLLPEEARQELLREAPVLTWGSFLDTWGKESGLPANARGLLLENHWGKVDPDMLIPADKIAEISVRSTYYQSKASDIRACSAPLRKGGLCKRKDLRTCPLHGPIIPRDSLGNPVFNDLLEKVSSRMDPAPSTRIISAGSESSHESTREANACLHGGNTQSLKSKKEIVGAILQQAITNVRATNESNKRTKVDLRKQRRKDREHNEAVLRVAALGQTAQGLQEILGEAPLHDTSEARRKAHPNKKGGLMALLRQKPTVKDRLAKRLLSGPVTDATVVQLTLDEERSYRQSFPNQW